MKESLRDHAGQAIGFVVEGGACGSCCGLARAHELMKARRVTP